MSVVAAVTPRDVALQALALDICAWPPKQDGSKQPEAEFLTRERLVELFGEQYVREHLQPHEKGKHTWLHRQHERPTVARLEQLYSSGRTGVGFVCGAISSGLELFEFDDLGTYKRFKEAAAAVGLGDLVERIRDGYESETPGNGIHWLTRSSQVSGNTKLASRPKRPDEMKHPGDKVQVLIETRGEGGYTVEAPSNGHVHPSGGQYRLLRGDVAGIVTITPEERNELHRLAQTFDQMPKAEAKVNTAANSQSGELRPGDDYAARVGWADILGPCGWEEVGTAGDTTYWKRPGTDNKWSATTNYQRSDLFYAWTTSTSFEAERGYGKFSAYAILNHGGDFSAAARELARQGYGQKTEGTNRESDATIDGRPRINAAEGDLRVITPLALDALVAANDPPRLYRHGGVPARLERDDHGAPVLRELTVDRVRHELARAATFYVDQEDKKTELWTRKIVLPPVHVAKDVLATPDHQLPIVIRITECPTFAPDGSLQETPGYHGASKTYCVLPDGLKIPTVPRNPSEHDIARARALLLDDLLVDFPFVSNADRANAVGAFVLPFVREIIPGPTPLHMFEAPLPGTGKGLCVEALLRPSCGRGVGTIAQAKDDDEWRKRITAMLRDGHSAIVLDNLTRPLDSGSLSMALTAPTWTDRVLGQTATVRYPVRCIWAATANNPAFSTEMARRTIRIRLDPRVDKPWDRDGWKHQELLAWVDDHRGELIWAGLVLVQSWLANGRPSFSGRALGSYERWSHVVGGILDHAGVNGFLGNLAEFYEQADVETAVWRGFVEAWWEKYQNAEVGTADLFTIAQSTDGLELGGGSENRQKVVFGKALARQRDRVMGSYRITKAGSKQRAARWRLLPIEEVRVVKVSEGISSEPVRTEDLETDSSIYPEYETLTNPHNPHSLGSILPTEDTRSRLCIACGSLTQTDTRDRCLDCRTNAGEIVHPETGRKMISPGVYESDPGLLPPDVDKPTNVPPTTCPRCKGPMEPDRNYQCKECTEHEQAKLSQEPPP
jgi:hypothetical protein